MANSNNWGEIYKSTWWGDEDWSANSLKIDSAPPGFAGGQNLLKSSEEFQQTRDWVRYPTNSQTPTVNADSRPDPNGGTTADQVGFTANTSARLQQTVTLSASTEYTFSVYARAVSDTVDFRMRNITLQQTEVKTATTTGSDGGGFTRFIYTFTTGAAGSYELALQNAAGTPTARDVIFWGAMLNQGGTAAEYEYAAPSTGGSAPEAAYAGFGDTFGGVTAYYSLRKFTEAETLNAIRVRKEVSSVDEEQDMGFDANGDLDTSALLEFATDADGGNVYVSIWYDQTGNGNDATNSTESEQPLIVSGGSVVTLDGYPCLDGDLGAGDTMLQALDVIDSVGDVAIFSTYALKTDGTTANQITFEIGNGTSTHRIHDTLGRGGAGTFGIDIRGTTNYDFGNATGVAVDDIYLNSILSETNGFYINGTQQTSNNAVRSGSTVDALTLFNRGGGAFPYKGKFFEFIFFASDQSANRGSMSLGTGIEGNINTYFDIV